MRSLILVVLLATAGCGNPPPPIFGELGHLSYGGEQVAPSANTVYACYTTLIYAIDVADPTAPVAGEEYANSDTGCLQGLIVQGNAGYSLSTDYVSGVSLPVAQFPGWVLELPEPADYYASEMVELPDGMLAVGRVSTSSDGGDLLFVDPAGPAVARRILDPVGYLTSLAVDGQRLVSNSRDETGTPDIVLRDLTAVTDTSLGAVRISLEDAPDGLDVLSLALRGEDLIVTAGTSDVNTQDFAGWIAWYQFDETFSNVSLVWSAYDDDEGVFDRITGFIPVLLDGYAIFAYQPVEGRDKTIVFRLDPQDGLVEQRRLRSRDYLGPLAVDESRGLLFVGGNAFQVFDLGAVTTGEPDW